MKPENKNMLECAAKACGIWNDTDPWNGMLKATGQYWNPKDNSADCAAMCTKLEIDTMWEEASIICSVRMFLNATWFEDHNNDREAAWRYAATMVAAKIGGLNGD